MSLRREHGRLLELARGLQRSAGQEFDAGAAHQLRVADGLGDTGRIIIGLPVRPGTLALSVINQLVEKAGHTHLVVADGGCIGIKDRAGDDVDIALSPLRIAARVFFDAGPGAAVLLDGLGTIFASEKLWAIACAVGMSPAGAMWPRE